MLRPATARRLPFGGFRLRSWAFARFSTEAFPSVTSSSSSPPFQPPPPPPPVSQQDQEEDGAKSAPVRPPTETSASAAAAAAAASEAAAAAAAAAEARRRKRSARSRGEEYEEEQARVLRAALGHVPKLGWTESAMVAGARDVGLSPSIVGSFPRKEAILVEFFMDDCFDKLINMVDSGSLDLKNLILSDCLSKLIRTRLEMQVPYMSKWAQALGIQAQPMNTSFRQRAMLVDEILSAAGDEARGIDWFMKRALLGGIYSTSEVYMLFDNSPEFRDTWKFVNNRVKDVFDVRKTVQEAAYIAETVGAGVGNSMQNFIRRLSQGFRA